MTPLVKNLLFGLGLIAIAGLGYFLFFGGSGDDSTLTQQNALVTSEAAQDSREFLSRIRQLERLDFQSELFTDPRFESLIDYRQDIGESSAGRSNPFAPVQ